MMPELRDVDSDEPLTREECGVLISMHARRASDAARGGSTDAARAHAAAAEALKGAMLFGKLRGR